MTAASTKNSNQNNKQMHIPMRMCIVTKQKFPKKDLIRIVYDKKSNKLLIDPTGKISSRGANISKSLEVFDEAVKKGSFSRAFKMPIKKENLEELRETFERYLKSLQSLNEYPHKIVRIKTDKI